MGNASLQQGRRAIYPAYKPSGMDWVGDIPEHWDVHRLKHIASVQFSSVDKHTVDNEQPVRLCNYVDVYYNDWIKGGLDFMAATATRSEIERFHLRHGDVLITKDSETWDDIAVPAYVAEELDGVLCGYHLAHIRPDLRKVLGEYLFHAFRSRGVNDQFRVAANGITRFGLGKYWLDNGLFPVPPLPEQKAIAAFLDRETARIDALIAKKQRQIELLQEKRSALISQAVTKGLSPEAPMKDSGIEWLGEIPAHWQANRLRFLVSEPLKYGANQSAELDDPALPRYIRITDVDDNGRLRDDTFKSLPEDFAHPYLLKDGDLLLARSGATVGKSFYYEPSWGRAAYAGYLIRARFDPARMVPRFVNYFTNSQQYWQWLGSSFIQATIQNVNAEKYANLVVPVPPVEEQAQIVSYLDGMWKHLNDLLEKVSASIGQLVEYRTALISAAVMGKIDVRGEVPEVWEMDSLRVFCEICDDIISCRFIREFNKQDHVFRSTKNRDGTRTSKYPEYDDDDFRSFMTHFRKLFLQNERGVKTDIYSVISILSRYGTARDRKALHDIKSVLNQEKQGWIRVNVEVDGEEKSFTPGDIMNLIVNADVFHSDAELSSTKKVYRKTGWIMQAPFLRFAISVVNNAVNMAKVIRAQYRI